MKTQCSLKELSCSVLSIVMVNCYSIVLNELPSFIHSDERDALNTCLTTADENGLCPMRTDTLLTRFDDICLTRVPGILIDTLFLCCCCLFFF